MSPESSRPSGAALFVDLWSKFKSNWRSFLAIHIAVNVLVFLVLAPISAALLRTAVSLSGDAALSDQDILFFVLSPAGFLASIVLASLFSIIIFLEYAALMVSAHAAERGRDASVRRILGLLAARETYLFRLALIILLRVLLTLLPYLALLGLIYSVFLTEYDINYYLAVKPPEWNQALALAAVVAAALAVHLVRLVTGLVFTLPLVLSGMRPTESLQASRDAAHGHRWSIARAILGWLALGLVLAGVSTWLVALAGRIVVPLAGTSVKALLLAMGSLSLLGFLASFLFAFLTTSMLALLILHLFRVHGLDAGGDIDEWAGPQSAKGFVPGRKTVVSVLAAGFLVALFLSHQLLNDLEFENPAQVMAHRGASGSAPENTMAAIERAIESGADWVEIDVQESADGEVVVIHDRDLKKIGGVALEVATSTRQELQQVDIGSWFAPEFADQRIPTLRHVLETCRDKIRVNIELKYYGAQVMLEQRVAEVVDSLGMADQVVIMSLSLPGIREMSRLRPDWTTGLLSSVSLGDLSQLDIDFLAINAHGATRPLIRHIHKQGKKVAVWTVNDAVGMASMASRGVDAIITDEPALAVSVLRQVEELEPAQRLMLQLAEVFRQPSLIGEQ